MRIKTITTAALVTTMLGLSGAAYAQTMIGNQNVSESDMERVKTYCEDLKTADEQAVGVEPGADEVTPAPDATADDDATALGNVDLDAVTLENCIEAGFVER